ncbi:MAG TPA: Lrp/AsnC family transcriptional regulator [Rubrivivax sp.]|nr:Lrp/AsnC family transcriptional regulator [Rubrivivax sp.]
MDAVFADPLDLALLNDWQHGFPLQPQPFAAIGARLGVPAAEVLARYRVLQAQGVVSRIGGAFGAGAGGAALLCAFAVPPARLDEVAAIVSAQPGVNHNYEREHAYNLWFVITGAEPAAVHAAVDALDAACGLRALRLPMLRPYRIDLGFDLRGTIAARGPVGRAAAEPVQAADRPLAACVELGLPLVEHPYAVWAQGSSRSEADVLGTLQRWLAQGTLRRFGVVVRHHETGFAHNAMTVFDVPDERVDACGERLAVQPGVTLAYRRGRDNGWRYNLYCMVHGRDRAAVAAAVDAAIDGAGLGAWPRARLFSRRRFKQCGARYFGAAAQPADTRCAGAEGVTA